jgi:hypothetical protein
MKPNPTTGCLIIIAGTFIWWTAVVLLASFLFSCKPMNIIHDSELIVVNVDRKNQEVTLRGRTINPIGYYYATYEVRKFGKVNEGDTLRIR